MVQLSGGKLASLLFKSVIYAKKVLWVWPNEKTIINQAQERLRKKKKSLIKTQKFSFENSFKADLLNSFLQQFRILYNKLECFGIINTSTLV
jgi:hypothetical protein